MILSVVGVLGTNACIFLHSHSSENTYNFNYYLLLYICRGFLQPNAANLPKEISALKITDDDTGRRHRDGLILLSDILDLNEIECAARWLTVKDVKNRRHIAELLGFDRSMHDTVTPDSIDIVK